MLRKFKCLKPSLCEDSLKNTGILRDKTMDDKLIFSPMMINKFTPDYTNYRLKLLVEKLVHPHFKFVEKSKKKYFFGGKGLKATLPQNSLKPFHDL